MTDIREFRAATPVNDERHYGVDRFTVGQRIRGGNKAMVERIETTPEGVRITLCTGLVRYALTYTTQGVARSEDEHLAAPEPEPPKQPEPPAPSWLTGAGLAPIQTPTKGYPRKAKRR